MKIALKKEFGQLVPYSKIDKEALDSLADGAVYEVDIKNMDIRSLAQNRALHKYFSILASVLNNSGQEITKVIKVDTPWSAESVKELLWRPVMMQQLNKKSTTKLTKEEVTKVYDTLNRALSLKCGVSVEFPNSED